MHGLTTIKKLNGEPYPATKTNFTRREKIGILCHKLLSDITDNVFFMMVLVYTIGFGMFFLVAKVMQLLSGC